MKTNLNRLILTTVCFILICFVTTTAFAQHGHRGGHGHRGHAGHMHHGKHHGGHHGSHHGSHHGFHYGHGHHGRWHFPPPRPIVYPCPPLPHRHHCDWRETTVIYTPGFRFAPIIVTVP